MSKQDDITKADRDLFRSSIGPVDKIEHDGVVFDPPKPLPVPKQSHMNERHVAEEITNSSHDNFDIERNDELLYKKAGVQQQTLRKLRRGKIAIEMELDLHGMTIETAQKALTQFLTDCRSMNRRCVRIIHGKGHGSDNNKPILKNKLNQWLQQHNDIMAFCSALPNDGGTGAVYVLIKRRKNLGLQY